MTMPLSDHAADQPATAVAEADAALTREAALVALAREAGLLALSAGREAMAPGRGATAATMAMITLAAETERVARRIEHAIDAMRRLNGTQGPSDAQIAAAAAALAAGRAIGAHSPSPADGTRVAAEGFAAAAAALDIRPRPDATPESVAGSARAN